MYSIFDLYPPFFPSFVDSLRAEIDDDVIVKSAHAHEIVSAFFGYKTYTAAKTGKLDQQIGIFPDASGHSNLPGRFYAPPDFEGARARVHRLMPDLIGEYCEIILECLDRCYQYESGKVSGYIARMSRQLSLNYESDGCYFNGSVYLIQEDWEISGDIASSAEYKPFTFTRLPWPEIQAIAMSKPLTVGDKLHQLNAEVIANIINFIAPDVIREITGVKLNPIW